MKKIILILSLAIAVISCQSEVEFNDPAFQGRVNNSVWKATIKSAKIEAGQLVLDGTSRHYNIVLKTAGTIPGTYALGTTNQTSKAVLTPLAAPGTQFTTGINANPVYAFVVSNKGTGYVTSSIVPTTGGSGSGLKVNIEANASGVITKATINVPGTGYVPGDVVTVASGNNNAKLTIRTVVNSNGEVTITKNADGLVSGKFKFVAFDAVTGDVTSCRDGVFYNMPLQ